MPNDDLIRARLHAMGTDDLLYVVTHGREGYVERALEIADQELAKRGVAVPPPDTIVAATTATPAAPRSGLGNVILALVVAGAFADFARMLVLGADGLAVIMRAVWAAIAVSVAIAARRWRRRMSVPSR